MKNVSVNLITGMLLSSIAWPGNAGDLPKNPNIVFILAYDFGYSSRNAYGADRYLLRTPSIDRLAEQGMRFTNASTPASICTPTRYVF